MSSIFFFNDTATTEIYTLSLHDALPISEAVITAVLVHEPRSFVDDAAWQAHLDRFTLGPDQRRRVTEAAVVGAILARGLLTDTVLVSDEAGQFDVFQHALCLVHGERERKCVVLGKSADLGGR